MSSTATICLFSVALCNIGLVDQNLFGQQQQQNGVQQQQGGGLFNQATNVFNGFANAAGLGNVNYQNNNQNQQANRQRQSPCPKKFTYASDGNGKWKGVIKLTKVNPQQDLQLDADFAIVQGRNVN